uniref:Uncharacterized protein n=1 Tax=Panstrongylus lignarius TaxID=156445 RepID=A0A224XVI1_9HEMI
MKQLKTMQQLQAMLVVGQLLSVLPEAVLVVGAWQQFPGFLFVLDNDIIVRLQPVQKQQPILRPIQIVRKNQALVNKYHIQLLHVFALGIR